LTTNINTIKRLKYPQTLPKLEQFPLPKTFQLRYLILLASNQLLRWCFAVQFVAVPELEKAIDSIKIHSSILMNIIFLIILENSEDIWDIGFGR
jgi:hypothetical protein